MKGMQILVVDDDPSIRKFVRANLEARNYEVLLATDGDEAIQIMEKELPDLILLDIMMPKMDGFSVCQQVREWSNVPIIMLSARDNEDDIVKCLDCGADDYITKPFSLRELLSRIRALLRRTPNDNNTSSASNFQYIDLKVDLLQNRVYLKEQEINLTPTEYKLLSYMAINAGRVITLDQLINKVWGFENEGDSHMLRVHLSRLRKKIGDDGRTSKYICCKPGIGYFMKNELE